MATDTTPTFIGTTTFQVEGMTCDHCRNAVTTEVSAVPGVQAVAVDVEAGTVTVSADQPVETVRHRRRRRRGRLHARPVAT